MTRYILLAEDNPGDVQLVREALEDRKVDRELHVVRDGEQALKFVEKLDEDPSSQCPDLFLLDLRLPRRGGEEILKRLRASGRCGNTPVVVLTSSLSPDDLETAQKGGVAHYFRKPTNLDQFMSLGDIVKSIVSGSA